MKHLLTTAATALILSTGAFADETPTAEATDGENLTTQSSAAAGGDASTDVGSDTATAEATDADNLSTDTASGDPAEGTLAAPSDTPTANATDGENIQPNNGASAELDVGVDLEGDENAQTPTAKATDAENLSTQSSAAVDGDAGTDAGDVTNTAEATDGENLSTATTDGASDNTIVEALNPTSTSKARDGENLRGVMETSEAYDNARTPFSAPSFQVDGYAIAATSDVTAEQVHGASVYGASGDRIGEVEEVISMGDDIKRVIIGVGGFLGLGEKDVNLRDDEFAILKSNDGEVRVYVDATEEALKAQPAFDG